MNEEALRSLRALCGDRLRTGEPLSRHTSFRIGGPADVWVEVETVEELRQLLTVARATSVPAFVLGGGTNVLVSDRGVRGLVIKLGRPFAAIEWHPNGVGTRIRAGAAVPFKKLVTEAARRSLAGLEFAEGIPGSLGGGLLMNAGAFGGEIARVIEAIEGVEAEAGRRRFARDELQFDYRHFDLPPGLVVTHLEFRLAPGDAEVIRARLAQCKQRREAHQPLGYPNAGSIFKNPPGLFAGRLIEQAGMKGRRRGGAMVSEQHANFIVNVGGATAADVWALMREVAERVWEKHAVGLQPEVKLVGEWGERW